MTRGWDWRGDQRQRLSDTMGPSMDANGDCSDHEDRIVLLRLITWVIAVLSKRSFGQRRASPLDWPRGVRLWLR